MTPAKNLRDIEDGLGAYGPQPGPAPAEPHEQRTFLARIVQFLNTLTGEYQGRSLADVDRCGR